VHFANCDTGAMVTCISSGALEVYPDFKAYFVADPDIVFGLADNPTEIQGVLRRVPISFGSAQERGSVVYCTFRVVKHEAYSIIFGLDTLDSIDAVVLSPRLHCC
jgi:hypothetical protein